MPTSLHRLVYVSRNATGRGNGIDEHEIDRILAAARRNNAAEGITGALLFNRACFVQILEGERDRIERVFERIERDPRHDDVTVIEFTSTPGRRFAAWSMGFVGGSAVDLGRFVAIAGDDRLDPSALDSDGLIEALLEVLHEREALPS